MRVPPQSALSHNIQRASWCSSHWASKQLVVLSLGARRGKYFRVWIYLWLHRSLELNMPQVLDRVRKTKHNRAWWLEEGAEVCPACGQTYVFQTEDRCEGCDGVVCAMCATQTTEIEIFCPPCSASAVESGVS